MKKYKLTVICVLLLSILATACGASENGLSNQATLAPEVIYTSAAKTAEALRVERFAQTATLAPEALIATGVGASPTALQTPTLAAATPVPATAVTTPAAPAGGDRAEFVADLSIPDGTEMAPNQTFQKGWRISNSGQTTWTTAYTLVFVDGSLMGAPSSIPLPEEVAPGEQMDISIDMVAPAEAGSYRGYWELQNAQGKIFGFGQNANESIWVDIVVGEALTSLSTTGTPIADTAIASVALAVDNAQVAVACPHTFIFTAQIVLTKPATVSYSLEIGAKVGAEIRLPQPATQNLSVGAHTIVYEITAPESIAGWARLHVTQPAQTFSNQVDFILTCG